MSRWPVLTAYVAGGMARVVAHPVIVGAVTAGALTLTGALLLLLGRARRPPPHRRSTGWSGAGSGPARGSLGLGGALGLVGQREGVDAVALPGVGGSVGEDVSQ